MNMVELNAYIQTYASIIIGLCAIIYFIGKKFPRKIYRKIDADEWFFIEQSIRLTDSRLMKIEKQNEDILKHIKKWS